MKTSFIPVLFAILVMAGCKNDSLTGPEPNFLQYDAPLSVSGNGVGSLTVSLIALKDTRCPQNVICIQPGWVELSLRVRNQTDSAKVETVFHANPERDKAKVFELGASKYQLTVNTVLPLPVEGKKLNINEYSIGLNISQL